MSVFKSVLLLVFVAFTAFSLYVSYAYGYIAIFASILDSPLHLQVGLDLVISLFLITCWMVSDARQRGRQVLPFLVLTLAVGSIGPMLYLLTQRKFTQTA